MPPSRMTSYDINLQHDHEFETDEDDQDEVQENKPLLDTRTAHCRTFRTPNGANNSMQCPWMGKGGMPYAISYSAFHIPKRLPTSSDVFEKLFKRVSFIPNKCRVNVLCFDFAALVTHDVFYTKGIRNKNSSYADLQPLYGNSKKSCKNARLLKCGLLRNEMLPLRSTNTPVDVAFSGLRAWIKVFHREHNRVCVELAKLYPDRFVTNISESESDEALYQTARIIVCAQYAQIIVRSYVAALVGAWDGMNDYFAMMDPKAPTPPGNHASFEFKMVYHWHSSLVENPLQPMDESTIEGVLLARSKMVSGQVGARNTPAFMKPIEQATIDKARSLGIATFNEVRKQIGFKPAKTFADINPDPTIVQGLKELYDHPDDVDYFVGLMIEEITNREGAAFAPTLGRAIIVDALNLIRKDTFLTKMLNPSVYTPYGYELVATASIEQLVARNTNLKLLCERDGHRYTDLFRVPRANKKEGLVMTEEIRDNENTHMAANPAAGMFHTTSKKVAQNMYNQLVVEPTQPANNSSAAISQ